jgi:hypothetical protein
MIEGYGHDLPQHDSPQAVLRFMQIANVMQIANELTEERETQVLLTARKTNP